MDTHPIIRDYFGRTFKENFSTAFKQANYVLFRYFPRLCNNETEPDDPFPHYNIEELLLLFRAIRHGCLADEHEEAIDIYKTNILDDDGCLRYDQCSLSYELSMWVVFFPFGWNERGLENLSEINKVYALGGASYCLMLSGYFPEAIKLLLALLKLVDEKNQLIDTHFIRSLVEINLILGKIEDALIIAKKLEKFRCCDWDHRVTVSYICQAVICCFNGRHKEALINFEQAKERDEGHFLDPIISFWYCSFLLERVQNDTDIQAVNRMLSFSWYKTSS